MRVVLSARIPANEVVVRPQWAPHRDAHALSGKTARVPVCVFFIMKSRVSRARLAVLPLTCAAAFPVLAQTTATLPETVVTATRFAQERDTLPMGVSVITADDIRVSGVTTVNEAVTRLLGVPGRLDFYGGANYTLDLRGFGETANSNQVVILDGQRLNEADMGTPLLAGIPVESIERIEVLRGSGAVLYGEGATGGVIVITTKAGRGKERRNTASVYGGVGSYGLRELRGNATLAAGGFSLDLSSQRRDADNHRDNFQSESNAGSVTAQWSNDAFRLGVRHSQDAVETGLPGGLSIAEFESDPSQTNTPTDWARIRNSRDGLFAEAWLGNWQLAADANRRDKQLRSDSYEYDVDANGYGLRARHESRLGELKNRLMIGHDHSRWTRVAYGAASNQKSRAWYLQNEVILASGTRLSGGVRTERIEKDANAGSSRLSDRQNAWEWGVSHAFSPSNRVWGRAGRSFRMANVDEFSFTNPAVAIRPQISRDIEAGWERKFGATRLEARLYRSALTDEIGYDRSAPNPFGGSGANVNWDPTLRQGFELDGELAMHDDLKLGARLNLRRASFRSGVYAGNDVPLVPGQSLSMRVQWSPAQGHRLNGTVNWVGSQSADLANQCGIPAYATVDARYAYQWDRWELSLGVTNLFDRSYYTLAFGCSGGRPLSVYPEAGRAWVASLRARF